ncbi:MAG: beta-N-acetylhexosaminidase [Acidimicrobiales bacterium]
MIDPTMDEVSAPIAIVPRPLRLTLGRDGATGCRLEDGLVISYVPELAHEARWFQQILEAGTGWTVRLTAHEDPNAAIELSLEDPIELPNDVASGVDERTRSAAYRLRTFQGRVVITSASPEGTFYALQTLRQLLPDTTFRRAKRRDPIVIAALEVVDAPRFAWRGVLLDVARHFMPKSFVLELIDLIALHKCNVLHLHLTDDQGWRLAVEAYPRLTEVGAWRREISSDGADAHKDQPLSGGFYTRADLEEIVTFASERHVAVLAEIDMPGHMQAAIAAYPALGNTDVQLAVLSTWGVSDHVLNLEDSTLRFCTDVLDEVVRIFPGPYVHVGGDECPTTEWKTNPRAQQIMREKGYADEGQLQGWFTERIAQHLAQLNRQLVTWDDILENNPPTEAIVMAWQDETRGVAAVAAGHDVVMVPQEYMYFDRPESNDPGEPVGFPAVTTLEKVYSYDPVPRAIPVADRHRVLGAQCQLWTEHVTTPGEAQYRYFPRLCAFAEITWSLESPERPKSYEEFEVRLRQHLGRLKTMGVNFRPLEGPHPG